MTEAEIILGQDAFERRFGKLYRALYRGDEPFKASFADFSWRFVFKTKSFEWNEKEFSMICDAISAVGDSEVVCTNLEFAPRHSLSCVLPLRYDAFVEAMGHEDLGWLHAGRKAIFGLSGSWAAIVDEVSYFAGGFALFGGTASFVDTLVHQSGGRRRVHDDFLALLNDPTVDVPSAILDRLLKELGEV